MLLVVGAPRSGTTWLGKILDSHPHVVYRHEPDSVFRTEAIATFSAPPYKLKDLEAARAYILALQKVHTIKVVGTLPLFRKSYFASGFFALYRAMILGIKVGERLPIVGDTFARLPVPERQHPGKCPFVVVKSIGALGRVGLFMTAYPALNTILIVRHPCGQIASTLRGIRMRKFESRIPITEDMGYYKVLADAPPAKAMGIDFAKLMGMEPIERLACRWAIANTIAMDALEECERGRIVRYEDLCENPASLSRTLFQFAGLDWNEQTHSFVNASTQYTGTERYYQVFRNPGKSAHKWRNELTPAEIDQVMRIVERTSAGRLFM